MPQRARGLGEGFGRQYARRDIAAPFGSCFAAGLDHGDGSEALEARLIGIALLAAHPADAPGDEMAAGFDAAVGLFGVARNVHLMGGRAVKIQLDLGMGRFSGCLSWPEDSRRRDRQSVRRCPAGSPWRRCRQDCRRARRRRAKFIEKQRDRRDLIGFVRHRALSEHQAVGGRVGRHRMQRRAGPAGYSGPTTLSGNARRNIIPQRRISRSLRIDPHR